MSRRDDATLDLFAPAAPPKGRSATPQTQAAPEPSAPKARRTRTKPAAGAPALLTLDAALDAEGTVRGLSRVSADGAPLPWPEGEAELVAMARGHWEALVRAAHAPSPAARPGRKSRTPQSVMEAIAGGMSPLRAWRHHRKLSLSALARILGTGKGYLSELENGKKAGSIDVLRRLAQALDVEVAALLAQA